jgi:hypothetical protein
MWVLKDLSQSEMFRAITPQESGFFEGAGLDGDMRVMAYVRPKRAPWIVLVSIPSARAYTRFGRSLWTLALSVLGAGAIALLITGLFSRG